MDYKKHLKDIRNKLASQQLSLLVGAGLSRNVSPKFLNWEELLIDLAYELYKSEIDTAFEAHVKSGEVPQLEQLAFNNANCIKYIKRVGYLEIVSEFIERRGYTESITTYIEDRIPGILYEDGKYYLEINGVPEEIPKQKLSLHRSLVDLPWNNIYTTNYDDLLDVCVDHNRYQLLLDEIAALEIEVKDTEEKIRKVEEDLENLSQGKESTRPAASENPPLENVSEPNLQSKQQVDQKKNEYNFKISTLKQTLSKRETLQRSKEKELQDCYQIVKKADGLRIKKQKNIIKLHGSLRSSEDKGKFRFGFDGDHKTQYIIAKEDYDCYPTQHEAFTQLMRISLLQESFCLLGFSGVDVNFRAWLNWVRDILHKAAKEIGKNHDYKIYLVEASESKVSKDVQLFYENHSIVRIPLLDPEVINVIQKDIGKPIIIKDRRDALEAFVLYLNNDEDVKVDIPSADISVRTEYRQAWERISIYDFNTPPDESMTASVLNKLDTIYDRLWLPNLDYPATHNQQSIVDYTAMAGWDQKLDDRPDLVRLLSYAIGGLLVPIQNLIAPQVVQKLLANELTSEETQRMINRQVALSADPMVQLPEIHDRILQAAFSFKFAELKELLMTADLTGKDKIVGAGFLALIDPEQSVKNLESAIWKEDLGRGEQMLYGLELLYFLTQPRIFSTDLRVARLISAFKESGYKLLQDAIGRLVKQVEKKRDKQKPYGKNRFTKSRSMQLTKGSDSQTAVQTLMLLAESGFQLTVGWVHLQSHDDWYPVQKAGFRFYPAAFLFYSLQYSNKDFLKKVGQDYAFSDNETVVEALPGICEALFKCLSDAPEFIRDHIPDFLSGLLVGVKPAVWQAHFGTWWSSLIKNKLAFLNDHRLRQPALIKICVLYIDDSALLIKTIKDCLQSVISGEQDDQAINILYYLNRNIYFKKLMPSTRQAKSINDLMDKIIERISAQRIDLIFVMGNLFRLLNDHHKAQIIAQLKILNLTEIDRSRVWRIIVYFANGDKELNKSLRAAIIDHRLLWHTGIDGNKVSGGGKDEFIEITALAPPILKTGGLKWSDSQIQKIYERLISSLSEIARIDVRDRWFNFTDVLEEMSKFLNNFHNKLKSQANFIQTSALVKECLEKNRNYADLEEGLTSRDPTEVVNALAQLHERYYEGRFEPSMMELVMNKILLQAEPALEESINYFSVWVHDKNRHDRFKTYHPLLIRILKKYWVDPLPESDEAFVEENLVRIAWQMNRWNISDEVIQKWIEKGTQSKFNNVLQLIAFADKSEDDLEG